MWQNTSFRIDLSLQAAFSIFSLTTAGVWPDKPDYKGSVLALSVKFFSAFFRKSFFHRPCANLLDFSSSLICLSESAFSQCSSSPPPTQSRFKVSGGPSYTGAPRVPPPSWRRNALCLQYAQFPLDKAWKLQHISELRSHS